MKHWMKGALVASTSVFLATTAPADVTMSHDKDFWKDGFDAMSEAGGFEHIGYATDQYKAFLQTSMTAGNPPDIFTWWTGNALSDIVASGQAAAVDELWDAKIESGEFAPGTRDLFTVDGQTYAIPLLLARWITFYNKEQFEAAGLESVPQTWEELEAAAEALKAAGFTPFNATVQDGWRGFIWFSELFIRMNPEAYAGLHTGEVPYDGPEVEAVFDKWVEWYEKGYFTDPRSTTEPEDFAAGKGAMYLMGEWATGLIADAGMTPGEDFGAFIMPNAVDAPTQVIVEGAPILISEDAWNDPDKRAAYEYWASVEGANLWAEAQSLYNGNLKAKAPNAIIQEVSDIITEGGHAAVTRWWEAVPSDIQGDLVAEMSAFMLEPTAEKAAEVMANMQSFNAEYWADQ